MKKILIRLGTLIIISFMLIMSVNIHSSEAASVGDSIYIYKYPEHGSPALIYSKYMYCIWHGRALNTNNSGWGKWTIRSIVTINRK